MLSLTINFWTSGAKDSANSLPPIFPTYREIVEHMVIKETILKWKERNDTLLKRKGKEVTKELCR